MKNIFKISLMVLALTSLGVACTPINHTIASHTKNTPTASLNTAKEVSQLNYISGIQSPEDLVQIPNTKWIIASGMTPKSGLHLINSQSKKAQRLIAPKASRPIYTLIAHRNHTLTKCKFMGLAFVMLGKVNTICMPSITMALIRISHEKPLKFLKLIPTIPHQL